MTEAACSLLSLLLLSRCIQIYCCCTSFCLQVLPDTQEAAAVLGERGGDHGHVDRGSRLHDLLPQPSGGETDGRITTAASPLSVQGFMSHLPLACI